MPNIITAGNLFPAHVVSEIYSKVRGHSTLAKLGHQMAVPFSGADIFTFSLDSEVSIVGENAPKPAGEATVATVSVHPLKIVHQSRLTHEFLYASEDARVDMLTEFADGFAKKIASGLDLMAMHGVNPATLTASEKIGTNHLDATDIQTVTKTDDPEADLTAALAKLGDIDATGYAMSKVFAADMGTLKVNGVPQYPEFKLGGNPGTLAGIACDVNSTVNRTGTSLAYVGDFANAFRWGYAANIPMEIIEYGDPDGKGDLKANNAVCVRAEAFVGWAILDRNAFVRVVAD